MTEANTAPAKYVFLDIVAFSRSRTVEAQAEIISSLNDIVRLALTELDVSDDQLILLPTGDGMCIALINVEQPFDVHLLIACSIIRQTAERNSATEDVRRQFEVRIGINANVDNLVTDIRGNRNVAGAGINVAQRVMSTADGNMIMVSNTVFDTLNQRERYTGDFKAFMATVKHGVTLPVYQYVAGIPGLKVDTPSLFKVSAPKERRYSKLVGCYVASALRHEAILKEKIGKGQNRIAGIAFLYFTALDLLDLINGTDTRLVDSKMPEGAKGTPEEQFEYFRKLDFELVIQFVNLIMNGILDPYQPWFASHDMDFWFVSDEGRAKLEREYPTISAYVNGAQSPSDAAGA